MHGLEATPVPYLLYTGLTMWPLLQLPATEVGAVIHDTGCIIVDVSGGSTAMAAPGQSHTEGLTTGFVLATEKSSFGLQMRHSFTCA